MRFADIDVYCIFIAKIKYKFSVRYININDEE